MKKYSSYILASCLLLSGSFMLARETSYKFLIFGGQRGWIGQKVSDLLREQGYQVFAAESRLENREEVAQELSRVKPDFVMNAAGVTGRPNIDWCEDHKQETIRANMIGALNLADLCFQQNIHMTNFGTGCIYEYDATHPIYSGIGFKEDEEPNFAGSFYSKTKIMLDKLLQCYPNVLNLRVRMPISDDLHSRSFVTKISTYARVINVPNSMTVLHDLLPVAIDMTVKRLKGNYNFVNPGVISHNEILDLYKKYIDPNFTYKNFTLDEQARILKAGRSNNELDCSKILAQFPHIPHIKQAMEDVFIRMKASMQK